MNSAQAPFLISSFNGHPIQETFEAPFPNVANTETPGTVFLDPFKQEFDTETDQKMTVLHPVENNPNDALSYDLDQEEPEEHPNMAIGDQDEDIAPPELPFCPLDTMSSNMSHYSTTAISLPVLTTSTNESVSSVPQFTNEASNVSVSSDAMATVCHMQNNQYFQLAESLSSIIFNFQSNLATQPQCAQFCNWNLPSITDSNGFILPHFLNNPAAALLKLNEKPENKFGFKPMHINPNMESPPVQEPAKVFSPTPAFVGTLAKTVQKLRQIAKKLSVEKRFKKEHVRQVFYMNHDKAIRVLENIEQQSTLKIFKGITKTDVRSFMQEMENLYDEKLFAFGEIMAAHEYTSYRPMAKPTNSEFSNCEKLLEWALKLLFFSAEKMNRAMTLCGANGFQLQFKSKHVKSENWDNFWNGLLEILKENPKLAKNVQFDVKFTKKDQYSNHCALKIDSGNFYLHVNEDFEEEFFLKTEKLREDSEIYFVGKENKRREEELQRKIDENERRDEKLPIFRFTARPLYKTASACEAVKFFKTHGILHRNTSDKVEGCQLVKVVIDGLDDFKELRNSYEEMKSDEEFAQYLCKSATFCGLLSGKAKNTAKHTHKLLVTFIVDDRNVPIFKRCLKPFDAVTKKGRLAAEEQLKDYRPSEENFFINEIGELNEHLETICQVNEFVTDLGIAHNQQAELAGGKTYLCENMTLERLEQIKSFEFFTSEYVQATATKFNTKKQHESTPGFGKPSVSFSVRLSGGYNPFQEEIEITGGFKRVDAVQIQDEFFARPDPEREPFCTGCVSCHRFFAPPKKEKKQKGKKKRRKQKKKSNQRKNKWTHSHRRNEY